MAVQPDGKILLAGSTRLHATYVARLLPGGKPDPDFGVGGVVVDQRLSWTMDLALQDDGRVLVRDESGRIARYGTDGQLDRTFGDDGYVDLQYPLDHPVGLLVLPDGQIAAGGNAVEKMFPSEALVEVFSADGSESWRSGAGLGTLMLGMGMGKGGSLVVSGRSEKSRRTTFLARFVPGAALGYPASFSIIGFPHPDPGYDRSFGGGAGLAWFSFPGAGAWHRSRVVALVPTPGGIVGAGQSEGRFAVAGFDEQGLVDGSFGHDGFVLFDRPGVIATARDVEAVGEKVLVVGDRRPTRDRACPPCATPLLMRLLPNGRLDRSFGRQGIARLPSVDGPRDGARGVGVAALSSGKVLVVGQVDEPSSSLLVGRLMPNGSPDRSFGSGGIVRFAPCAESSRAQRQIGCLPRRGGPHRRLRRRGAAVVDPATDRRGAGRGRTGSH